MKAFFTSRAVLFCGMALLWSSFAEAVTLKVFEWEGYISPFAEEFKTYAKANNKDVTLEFVKNSDGSPRYIGSSGDIFEVTRAKEADVVTPTHNYYLAENGKLIQVLAPLDYSKISNLADVFPEIRDANYARDGEKMFGVPLLGGSYALAYNTKTVTTAPDSWEVLFDPKNQGRISVTEDQFEANIYQIAMMTGTQPKDVYDESKVDSGKIAERLKQLHANVKLYWKGNPSPDTMKDLDYITDYWFGVAAANKQGQAWKIVKPKEGETLWFDSLAIGSHVASDPEKMEAAYLLVNFMLSPEIQKKIAELYGSVIFNQKTMALWSPEQAKNYTIANATFFHPDYLWQPLSARTKNRYQQLWLQDKKK